MHVLTPRTLPSAPGKTPVWDWCWNDKSWQLCESLVRGSSHRRLSFVLLTQGRYSRYKHIQWITPSPLLFSCSLFFQGWPFQLYQYASCVSFAQKLVEVTMLSCLHQFRTACIPCKLASTKGKTWVMKERPCWYASLLLFKIYLFR